MGERMFEPGERLDLAGLVAEVVAGRYVFMREKPVHPGWVGSMQLRTLQKMAERGAFRDAVLRLPTVLGSGKGGA